MTANNPAGRLHRLLQEFDAAARDGMSIIGLWSKVLVVEPQQALPAMAKVAGLLPAIESALVRMEDSYQQEVFDHYSSAWARPIFAPDLNMHQTSPTPTMGLVDRGSLVSLGSLAAFLSATMPEGQVPLGEVVDDLRGQASALLEGIRTSDELDPPVRRLLLDHMHAVSWALDDLAISGPGGVKVATERLAGAVAIHVPAAQRTGLVGRSLQFAGAAWVAFSAGPTVQTALEAWKNVAGVLPPG